MMKHKAVFEGGCGEIVEKKSRFIAHVQSVETVEEAQDYIEAVKKRFWDARHNCSAFCVGTDQVISRSSDDGEPSGTAGKPILEVIRGSGIHNIVIVVTRYFGGTLLGTGGLVRAYTAAARAGIDASRIIEKIPGIRVDVSADYNDLGKIQYVLAQNGYLTEDTIYTDKVLLKVLVPLEEIQAFRKKLANSTAGRSLIEEKDQVYYGSIDKEIIVFDI